MSNLAVIEQRKPALIAGDKPAAIVPTNIEQVWRFAELVSASGMAPRGMDKPETITVAIMHGLEIGLTPLMALQRIAVVNGRPTIWGDAAMALVRASGRSEYVRESIRGEGDAMVAVCDVKRRDESEPHTSEFSVADAEKAGLWGKSGPWQQYPKRMLQMRARAFALRDTFADVLGGLYLREEMEGHTGSSEPRDITPRDEPPAPPPTIEAPKAEVIEPAPAPAPMQADDLDIPANLRRTARATTDAMPSPDTDPEAFIKWLNAKCATFTTYADMEAYWNERVAPMLDMMFPPDQEECMGIWRRNETRLAP